MWLTKELCLIGEAILSRSQKLIYGSQKSLGMHALV